MGEERMAYFEAVNRPAGWAVHGTFHLLVEGRWTSRTKSFRKKKGSVAVSRVTHGRTGSAARRPVETPGGA